MKKLLMVVLCCVIGVESIYLKVNPIDADDKILMSIYPTGILSETYYFSLDSKGKLIVEKGERNDVNVNERLFMKNGQKQKVIYLSEICTEQIYSLADNVVSIADSSDYVMMKDSWEVQILYKGELIKQNYYNCTNQSVKDLVDEIIKVSAVEVNMRDWS